MFFRDDGYTAHTHALTHGVALDVEGDVDRLSCEDLFLGGARSRLEAERPSGLALVKNPLWEVYNCFSDEFYRIVGHVALGLYCAS